MNTAKKKIGRPFGTVKPNRKDGVISVRVTPALMAYLESLRISEGFSYSDGTRMLMLEAMRARGVTISA